MQRPAPSSAGFFPFTCSTQTSHWGALPCFLPLQAELWVGPDFPNISSRLCPLEVLAGSTPPAAASYPPKHLQEPKYTSLQEPSNPNALPTGPQTQMHCPREPQTQMHCPQYPRPKCTAHGTPCTPLPASRSLVRVLKSASVKTSAE